MCDRDPWGDFYGARINYAEAFCDAREKMGDRRTDLDALAYNVGLLWLRCPEWMQPSYLALVQEIVHRKMLMELVEKG